MKIIGRNVFLLRKAIGLNQAEVSDGFITRDYISRIESGDRPSVSQTVIRSLAMKLNTTEEWLTKNTGWSYDPPTTLKALSFITRQIDKFKPSEVVIITYSDGDSGKLSGFVFIRPDGLISIGASHTRSGYHGNGSATYKEMLEVIKEAKIKVRHIELNKTESRYLLHTDLVNIANRASHGNNRMDKDLLSPKANEYPEKGVAKSACGAVPIVITVDEIVLFIKKMEDSKTGIQELIKYMDDKLQIQQGP